MTPSERAEKIIKGQPLGTTLDQAVEFCASQIREAEKEAVQEIANRQALIHGESAMIDGKLITNEEMYKQPVDWYKAGRASMREEAAKVVESFQQKWEDREEPSPETIAERIRGMGAE